MKKPRIHNYLAAQALNLTLHIGGSVGIISLCSVLPFKLYFFENLYLLSLFIVSSIVSYLLGMLLGMFTLWPILHFSAKIINGGPLRTGDHVVIITGNYTNSHAKVVDVYPSIRSLKVKLLEADENGIFTEFFIQDHVVLKI